MTYFSVRIKMVAFLYSAIRDWRSGELGNSTA